VKPLTRKPPRSASGRLAVLFAAAFLALAGCLGSRNASGTGTETGNTVSARVVLPGGTPAAGARVTLYPVEFVPTAVPGAARSAPSPRTAVTDSAGRFTLEAEAGSVYLLEGIGSSSSDSLMVWKKDVYLREDEATTDLGTLSLEISGALSGTVIQPDGASAKEVWAGFHGTGRFTRADEAGNFTLKGIPPGGHELLLIRDTGPGNETNKIKLSGWHLAPGAHGKLDTVSLGAPTPGEIRLQARACIENPSMESPALIVEYPYEGPSAGERRELLRTILETNPPQWIEIDPCLGTWRSKGVLPPEAVSFIGSMSNHESDFLALDDKGRAMKIDSNGRVSQFLQFPPFFLSAQFYRGKVYAMFNQFSVMKVYASEAAFLLDQTETSLELGFQTFEIRALAIADSIAYFIEDNTNPKYHAFDLRSRTYRGAFNLAGFEGAWYSFTSAPGGRFWILNDSGLIQLGDPATRTILRKLQIVVPGKPPRGLTRFQGEDSE
jgi:hypothetical protein